MQNVLILLIQNRCTIPNCDKCAMADLSLNGRTRLRIMITLLPSRGVVGVVDAVYLKCM
jgi:hypothetical protein